MDHVSLHIGIVVHFLGGSARCCFRLHGFARAGARTTGNRHCKEALSNINVRIKVEIEVKCLKRTVASEKPSQP